VSELATAAEAVETLLLSSKVPLDNLSTKALYV